MLGEIIQIKGINYIVVSDLGNEIWLFNEEVAKTCKPNEHEMFIKINLEEVEEFEQWYMYFY